MKNNHISAASSTFPESTVEEATVTSEKLTVTPLKRIQDHEIHLEGGFNVRDLGGFETQDGRIIKPHTLIRSARLNHLTTTDIETLVRDYHVAVDFDLRRADEVESAKDPKMPGVTYIDQPLGTMSNFHFPITPEHIREHYRTYVSVPQARYAYHQFFMAVLNKPVGRALLYHCASGKDRTGVGTALLMHVLGIDGDTIIQDYVASNDFLRDRNDARIARMKKNGISRDKIMQVKYDSGVDATYLEAAFDEIHREFGNLDTFIEKGLRVTPDQQAEIRKRYLI